MSNDIKSESPQTTMRLLVNMYGLISGLRLNEHSPDLVFGQPEVVRIKANGEVMIAEGAELEDAARAFWDVVAEWRCVGSRPTLADAQPGGRVRLGDQPWPEIDAILADAYSAGATGLPFEGIARRHAVRAAVAALSAQLSPGGQGDAVTPAMVDAAAGVLARWAGHDDGSRWVHEARDALEAALVARQPVGEPVDDDWHLLGYAYASKQATTCAGCGKHKHTPLRIDAMGGHVCLTCIDQKLGALLGEFGYPPAQAVDLVRARDSIQALLNWIDDWAETPEESGLDPIADRALEVVAQIDAQVYAREPNAEPNRLTDTAQANLFYIQDTRQVVGNCPMWWGPNGSGYVTRLDEAGRYTEQEAIRQNRTRETDIPWPCSEIDALARPMVDCQHMRPRAERLAELALIDIQAAGK
ncbi:TPA: hypothetical protein ACOFD8_002518 [Stenotrophomonas maltophilia]